MCINFLKHFYYKSLKHFKVHVSFFIRYEYTCNDFLHAGLT